MYDVASDRRITWNAGLDPVGGIPARATPYQTLTSSATYSDINTAITNCSNAGGGTVYLDSGTYTIAGPIYLKSNVTLRGAGANYPWLPTASSDSTTLNLTGSTSYIDMQGSGATNGTEYSIISGYTQGSEYITVSSGAGANFTVGDWVNIYENTNDTTNMALINCAWAGRDTGDYYGVKQQYSKVIEKSGDVLRISPSLHLVFGGNPVVRTRTFGITMAGVENLKLNNVGHTAWNAIVHMQNDLYCWTKNVETYYWRSSNIAHIYVKFSHGCEVRDSYVHHGSAYEGGQNYGIRVQCWNSEHKIENNIGRDTRHSIVFDGGGTGCVVLYNYTMDNWESGTSGLQWLTEDLCSNHGLHPNMNLFEGNCSSNIVGDIVHGSSSHNTLFRNRCVAYRDSPSGYSYGHWGIDIHPSNHHYNIVGNVVGKSDWTTGTVIWGDTETVCTDSQSINVGIRFNCSGWPGSYSNTAYPTAVVHGNYDTITDDVANWADADHNLMNSMYYTSKPSFFGDCVWPPIGYDVTGNYDTHFWDLPALARYENRNVYSGARTLFRP